MLSNNFVPFTSLKEDGAPPKVANFISNSHHYVSILQYLEGFFNLLDAPRNLNGKEIDLIAVDEKGHKKYLELIQKLKESSTAFLPILLISNAPGDEALDRVDEVIHSDVSEKLLQLRINNLLKRRGREVALHAYQGIDPAKSGNEKIETYKEQFYPKHKEASNLYQILDAITTGIVVTDPFTDDDEIIYCNMTFLELTGYSKEEVIGKNCRFLQGNDMKQEGLKELREALRENRPHTITIRNYRKDGTLFWNRLKVAPLYDSLGKLRYFTGVQEDVTTLTERLKEKACLFNVVEILHDCNKLRVQELDEIIHEIPAGFRYPKNTAVYLRVGGTSCQTSEFKDEKQAISVPIKQKEEVVGEIKVILTGEPAEHEPIHFCDNERMMVEKIAKILSNHYQFHKANQALEKREANYRSLFDNHPEAIFMLDTLGNIEDANQSAHDLLDGGDKFLEGFHYSQFVDPIFLPSVNAHFFEALEGKVVMKEHFVGFSFGNEKIGVKATIVPIMVEGKVRGVYAILQDISLKLNAEFKSEQNRKLLETISENTDSLIFVKDKDNRYTYVNPQFAKFHGMKREEVVGKTSGQLFKEQEELEAIESNENYVREQQMLTSSEEYIKGCYHLINKFPLNNVPGLEFGIGGVATDVTHIKEAEKRNRKQREVISYLSTDQDYASKNAEEKLESIVKISAETFEIDQVCIWVVSEDDKLKCLASYSDGGQINRFEGIKVDQDSNPKFWADLSNSKVVCEENVDFERYSDFAKKYGIRAFTSAVFLVNGRIQGFIGYYHKSSRKWENDEILFAEAIADQVAKVFINEESNQYKQKLEESLKEKESLLKEIHHRVKNNMAVISSLLQMQAMTEESPEVASKLIKSVNRIKSMAGIHERLYESSRFSEIEMLEHFRKLSGSIKDTMQIGSEVSFNFEGDEITLELTRAIPCSLIFNEVVTNSFKHAFKEMDEGVIAVDIRQVEDYIILRIADNSDLKMPEMAQEKNKSIGMQIIEDLVSQLEGTFSYKAEEEGTVFRMNFPINKNEE